MNETILVVDDEADIRDLLASILSAEGYAVLTASDGAAGIERFRRERPALVLTDIRMPVMNGLDLLKAVKAADAVAEVIVLTGHSDQVTAIECLRMGASDYFLKPLEDIEVLVHAVKKAIDKRQLILDNEGLMRELEELAIRDPLTGLFNRRQLELRFDAELRRAARYDRRFCFLMMDIDHFKAVNDDCGHPFGDFVLRELGVRLRDVVRVPDEVFRYGGEEFCSLHPETDGAGARVVCERLLSEIEARPFDDGHQHREVTISIGAALYPEHGTSREALIQAADHALYQAKHAGRKRVVFAGEWAEVAGA